MTVAEEEKIRQDLIEILETYKNINYGNDDMKEKQIVTECMSYVNYYLMEIIRPTIVMNNGGIL